MAEDGFILDLSANFFANKTAADLLALGYSEAQIPFIGDELAKQGLTLKKEEPKPGSTKAQPPIAPKAEGAGNPGRSQTS